MHKLIIAGCGGISRIWFKEAVERENCEIVALVDINTEAAEAKKEEYSLANVNIYSSIEAALESENANLVFDITIPEAHYDTVTKSLDAGCNVFGEKPMSDLIEDAEKMVKHVEKSGMEYFVMQNYRYNPQQIALKKFLESQKLGKVGQISATFRKNPHFGGFRDEMDSPLLADMSIHTFDSARYIISKNPISVFCHEFNPSWSWYKGNANAVCIFEMEDGVIFDYNGSWCANGYNTPWNSEWSVACTDGSVYWDGAEKLYYVPTEGEPVDIHVDPMDKESHAACIREMFDCLEKGKRPPTDCRDNIHSMRMVHKAIESAKHKKLIKF